MKEPLRRLAMLALEWGLDTEEELRSTPRSAPLKELLMLALLSMRSAGATLTPALLPVTCTQGTHAPLVGRCM